MSAELISVSFRINPQLKKDAEKLFDELGLSMTAAFNMFLRQAVREGGIPFNITTNVPNKETLAAMAEAKRIAEDKTAKSYSLDEAFEELDK